ncbi:glycerate kinase family protein [Anaerobiospirillum succiniciproducens]|uniref:glycerate kinase family protein n=1 Tax=Anaerobiospirillum succiniciproducens TaxID=13335 RepID=UPI003F89FA35
MVHIRGIELNLNHPREGEKATTYGLGQLIGHILSLKCRTIKIGLGGSATNDAGAGFAQALGAKFYDSHNQLITEPLCGSMLSKIARVDTSELDAALKDVEIFGTCDVTNPLTGSNGATYTFGPQKGIKVQNLATLDEAMQSFATLMNAHYKRSVDTVAGAGAAGGMGAALLWFAHGTLERGIDIVMRILKLEEKIKDSFLVIVGEGRIDGQSLQGKAPLGVAKLAQEHKVPVIALCGSIGTNAEALYEHGINAIYSLCTGPMTLDEAMSNAEELIEKLSYNIARTVSLSLN